jgi:anti-sigma factor RsiW
MTCEKIKELILTDYIDNQMSDEDKIRIDIHLANCRKCKELLETVKNTAVKPFANAKKMEPPEFIWQRVKEAILAQQQERPNFATSILEKLKSVLYIPKPVFAVSTIMALVLIVAVTITLRFSNKQALEASREEQAEYSAYSTEAPVGAFLNNEGGFGTLVEQYFL